MFPAFLNSHRDGLVKLVKQYALEIKGDDEPPFVLSNGGTSRYYIDCRQLTLHNHGLRHAVDFICEMLRWLSPLGSGKGIDAVGGLTDGASPIVGGLLYSRGKFEEPLRGFLVRKEAKQHGKGGYILGSMRPGDNCLLVEDVVNTGVTSMVAIDKIELYGGKVVQAIAIMDRLEGGGAASCARRFFRTHSAWRLLPG